MTTTKCRYSIAERGRKPKMSTATKFNGSESGNDCSDRFHL